MNLLPALREANPGREIWYFTDPSLAGEDALGTFIRQAGADQVMHSNVFDQWSKNAYMAKDLIGYPLAEGYPDKPMRSHLLRYFADEMGLEHVGTKPYGLETIDSGIYTFTIPAEGMHGLPALTLPLPPQAKPSLSLVTPTYITVQRSAGWSKYKEWSGWNEAVDRMRWGDVRFVEIDKKVGFTLAESIAIFANARMHIGIDSFCNHLTNYYWQDEHGNGRRVPGVILWGSTQSSAAGYPHNKNISLGLSCQPCFIENPSISRMDRGPCTNPPRANYSDDTPWACMEGITVERVVEAIRAKWEECE